MTAALVIDSSLAPAQMVFGLCFEQAGLPDGGGGLLKAEAEYEFHRTMSRELAIPVLPPSQNDKTKPMPAHLAAELERHKRRDPDFGPVQDRSQMSKALQRWFSER